MPRSPLHIAGFLLSLVLVLCAQASLAADWLTVTGDGKFTILMPATPEQSSDDANTESGRVTLHTYSSYGDDDVLYGVSYSDFADGALGHKSPQQFLRDAQSGSVKETKMTLRSSQEIELGRWPGRAFVSENDKLVYSAHLYLVGNRFYQVVRIGPKTAAAGPDAAKFFDSFRLAGE